MRIYVSFWYLIGGKDRFDGMYYMVLVTVDSYMTFVRKNTLAGSSLPIPGKFPCDK